MSSSSSSDQILALGGAPPLGWPFSTNLSLEDLRGIMANFVDEREWHKFHTPRNILLALVGEVGEVAELFQFRGEVAKGCADWSEKDRVHLGEELSDVLLYLVRLSDLCKIDLPAAALRKVERNKAKYPVDRCKGRSDKYTAYQETVGKTMNQETIVETINGEKENFSTKSEGALSSSATPSKVLFPSVDENRSSPTASLITRFNTEAEATTPNLLKSTPGVGVIIVAVISGAVATFLTMRAIKR
jgi:dCTP diphosphatase